MHKFDWNKLDEASVDKVKNICENIYSGNGDRPKRVTVAAIEKSMGWTNKRQNYLPKCREIIRDYEESIEEYWAREVVWAYKKIEKEEYISWRRLRNITNLRKINFEKCKPFLKKYIDTHTAKKIKELI